MPTIPGPRQTTSNTSPSDALCRLLATGTVGSETDWRLAVAAASQQQDLALLSPWLDDPRCQEAERQAIRLALITQTARNQLFLTVLKRCLDWFSEAGIATRVLKGAATIQDCYDGPGQRRLGDIDLLVPKERLAEAASILQAHDFKPLLPTLEREALHDPHLLTAHTDAHHHWPPLVGPDGVVVELHWTPGDGFAALGIGEQALWEAGTELPTGTALAWPHRVIHAALAATATAAPSPRAVADLAALLKRGPSGGVDDLGPMLALSPGGRRLTRWLEQVSAGSASWPVAADSPQGQAGIGTQATLPRWRRRLAHLRTPSHVELFLILGWQAWRYPYWLQHRSLPATAAALANDPHWQGRVSLGDVVAFVGFWQRQRWISRPSYCLQRSALLFAGLTAIGEKPTLIFGLDPDHPSPIGHAWVERAGEPFLEDAVLIARMVQTYRHSG